MRILHLVLAPRLSGAEVLAKDLAIHQKSCGETVAMASLLPQHADFTALHGELEAREVTCIFPPRPYGRIGRLWWLRSVVRRFKPDVLLAHSTIPAFYARVLPLGVPVIYVMHSATNDFVHAKVRGIERLLSRRARAVIGVSENNVKEYIEAIGRHRMMQVIPNGVDTSRYFYPTGVEDGGRPPQILQVGRYNSIKCHLQTVRAFAQICNTVPDLRLMLVGVVEDPSYFAAVQDLVRQLGLEQRVTVDGPRSNISQLLTESTVYTMPSLSEAHSIALLEALATGIPVVANTISAFAYTRNFPCVQLIDTNDIDAYAKALMTALRQPRTMRQLAGLTLSDAAEQYLAISRKVAFAA
jgi:glycosyltransferase involved in cell wall biosynthesis